MKIQKLNESVFEKLRDMTPVITPVMDDAIKDHDVREKAIEQIMKERGKGQEFTGSSETAPVPEEAKPTLEEGLFTDTLQEKHDKTKPATQAWQDLGNDGREQYDFWDKVYAELIEDASFANTNTRNKLRELPDPVQGSRYNGRYKEDNFSLTDDGDIRINVAKPEELDFAKQVAEHYGIPSEERQSNRFAGMPYSLTLYISRMDDANDASDEGTADN